jgi:pyruvate/2-oxoglutarate dehydrogenase complex dihydrolipoamide acyltransferase (E2) component
MPEGILERWLVEEGATVDAGDPVARIRINESVHEIMAPVSGRISAMSALNTVVDPGSPIAQLDG